jgi:tRNA 5-methylaminomethyl-2-thiouridine biosynthesis bifunctional protein
LLQKHFDVLIIGAGIAGTTLASQYGKLGLRVCLIDEQGGPGRSTSAHAGAISHPALGRTASKLHKIALAAFRLTVNDWQDHWESRGVFLQSKANAHFDAFALSEKLHDLGLGSDMAELVSLERAKQQFGVNRPGVWFPGTGSMNLGKLCQHLVRDNHYLHTVWSSKIARIEKDDGNWLAFGEDNNQLAKAHTVILANAFGAQTLLEPFNTKLFLKPVRGQLSIFEFTKESGLLTHLPKTIVSGEGYCLPPHYNPVRKNYQWLVGSSYDEHDDSLLPRAQSDQHNLELAKAMLAPLRPDCGSLKVFDRFVGIRCVTKDRLPLIGGLSNLDNVYVVSALGSRGLLWATLASYVIPALSHSSTFALDRLARFGLDSNLLSSLSPTRFLAGALASNSKPIFPPTPKAR